MANGLDVWLNGERLCIAGIDGSGVVSAILHWVRRIEAVGPQRGKIFEECRFYVGAHTQSGQNLRWTDRALSVGDEIRVDVVRVKVLDAPAHRSAFPGPEAERRQAMYERLKEQFEHDFPTDGGGSEGQESEAGVTFKVFLNGVQVCAAGIDGLGVVTVIDNLMQTRRERQVKGQVQSRLEREIDFSVSGSSTRTHEHLDWCDRPLRVGDAVLINVTQSRKIDEPVSRTPACEEPAPVDPEVVEPRERELYERLKQEFE